MVLCSKDALSKEQIIEIRELGLSYAKKHGFSDDPVGVFIRAFNVMSRVGLSGVNFDPIYAFFEGKDGGENVSVEILARMSPELNLFLLWGLEEVQNIFPEATVAQLIQLRDYHKQKKGEEKSDADFSGK